MLKSPPRLALLWRALASLLFVAAFALFCWRGPGRAMLGESYDFSMLYASSAALADGGDPYVLADAGAAMAARGGQLNQTAVLLYPPSALVALRPLTWFSWPVARLLWVGLQLVAFFGLAAGLQRLAGAPLQRGATGWLFMMALLLWAPIHTGLHLGQVALPVVFLMVWSVMLAGNGKRVGAGLLLGLAMALKPQLGLAFLPVLILRGHWFALVWSLAAAGGLYVLGMRRLDAGVPDWMAHWSANFQAFTHGGYGDIALPWARAQMVQASALLAALGVAAAVAMGYGFAAFAGCFWLLSQWRERLRAEPLAMMAALSLLALLAGYHRSYDAVLALVPMAYGLRLVAAKARSVMGWSLVGLLAVFLTPGGTLLAALFPAATAAGPWWVQFQTLALLAAAGVCIVGGSVPLFRKAA